MKLLVLIFITNLCYIFGQQSYQEVSQSQINNDNEIQDCLQFGIEQIIYDSENYHIVTIQSVSESCSDNAKYYKFSVIVKNQLEVYAQLDYITFIQEISNNQTIQLLSYSYSAVAFSYVDDFVYDNCNSVPILGGSDCCESTSSGSSYGIGGDDSTRILHKREPIPSTGNVSVEAEPEEGIIEYFEEMTHEEEWKDGCESDCGLVPYPGSDSWCLTSNAFFFVEDPSQIQTDSQYQTALNYGLQKLIADIEYYGVKLSCDYQISKIDKLLIQGYEKFIFEFTIKDSVGLILHVILNVDYQQYIDQKALKAYFIRSYNESSTYNTSKHLIVQNGDQQQVMYGTYIKMTTEQCSDGGIANGAVTTGVQLISDIIVAELYLTNDFEINKLEYVYQSESDTNKYYVKAILQDLFPIPTTVECLFLVDYQSDTNQGELISYSYLVLNSY